MSFLFLRYRYFEDHLSSSSVSFFLSYTTEEVGSYWQRLSCLKITEAITTTLTAAIKGILNLLVFPRICLILLARGKAVNHKMKRPSRNVEASIRWLWCLLVIWFPDFSLRRLSVIIEREEWSANAYESTDVSVMKDRLGSGVILKNSIMVLLSERKKNGRTFVVKMEAGTIWINCEFRATSWELGNHTTLSCYISAINCC